LKPHNVFLLAHDGRQIVKILDFGVAKMSTGWDTAQSGGHSVKTRTGSLMGTPLYMSPEQCRGSGKLDHRTDIYSLAVILFEMLSGRPPFVAEGVGELFAKHMLEPAPSLAEFAPQTPPHIVRAVARALSKELDDRFPTMTAFREALSGKEDQGSKEGPEGKESKDGEGASATAPKGIPDARPRRSLAQQPATLQGPHGSAGGGGLPPEQTTLSSMVSELEGGDIDGFPKRGRRGLAIGIALATVAIGGMFGLLRRSGTSTATTTNTSAAPPAPRPAEPASPPPVAPQAPSTVIVKFEAEPATAHVFRKVEGKPEGEDLGIVPLEVKLARGTEGSDFVLRAEHHKERAITVEASHDQIVQVALERLPALDKDKDKDKRAKPAPPRPARPKRPVIHDADGLAVPSF
jgi:serine/threonine-protein kinase